MRSISSVHAMLIVLAVAVAVGVFVASVILAYINKNAPEKGVLSLAGSEAVYYKDEGVLWVTLRGEYTGADLAFVDTITVMSGSKTLNLNILSATWRLEPNTYFKSVATGSVSSSDIADKLVVTVQYCFSDGTCASTSATIPVIYR